MLINVCLFPARTVGFNCIITSCKGYVCTSFASFCQAVHLFKIGKLALVISQGNNAMAVVGV